MIDLVSQMAGDIPVLVLSGRFDAFEVEPVKGWFSEHASKHQALMVDMTGVVFVDSTALSTLVQGMKHQREGGGDLYLVGLQDTVKVIFELTRLDKAFQIFDTMQQATDAIHDKAS